MTRGGGAATEYQRKLYDYIPQSLHVHYRTTMHQVWKCTLLTATNYGKMWSLYHKQVAQVLLKERFVDAAMEFGLVPALQVCQQFVPSLNLSQNVADGQWLIEVESSSVRVEKHWRRKCALTLIAYQEVAMDWPRLCEYYTLGLRMISGFRAEADVLEMSVKCHIALLDNAERFKLTEMTEIYKLHRQFLAQWSSLLSQEQADASLLAICNLLVTVGWWAEALDQVGESKSQAAADVIAKVFESCVDDYYVTVYPLPWCEYLAGNDGNVLRKVGRLTEHAWPELNHQYLTATCQWDKAVATFDAQVVDASKMKHMQQVSLLERLQECRDNDTARQLYGQFKHLVDYESMLVPALSRMSQLDDSVLVDLGALYEELGFHQLAVDLLQEYVESHQDALASFHLGNAMDSLDYSYDETRLVYRSALGQAEPRNRLQLLENLEYLALKHRQYEDDVVVREELAELKDRPVVDDVEPAVVADQSVDSDAESYIGTQSRQSNCVRVEHLQYGMEVAINNVRTTFSQLMELVQQKFMANYYLLPHFGAMMCGSVMFAGTQLVSEALRQSNTLTVQVLNVSLLQPAAEFILRCSVKSIGDLSAIQQRLHARLLTSEPLTLNFHRAFIPPELISVVVGIIVRRRHMSALSRLNLSHCLVSNDFLRQMFQALAASQQTIFSIDTILLDYNMLNHVGLQELANHAALNAEPATTELNMGGNDLGQDVKSLSALRQLVSSLPSLKTLKLVNCRLQDLQEYAEVMQRLRDDFAVNIVTD